MNLITVYYNCFKSRTESQEEVLIEIDDINKEMRIRFKSVFEEQGNLDGKMKLEVIKDDKAVKIPARKLHISNKHKLKQELHRLKQLELIKSVDSPTD